MSDLFSQDLLHAANSLHIRARQVPAGGPHGDHRSRDYGSGMEFRDFRGYTPGDDLRRVDWNIYRRTGRPFLRLFDEPENLNVFVLLDVSDSMFFETPSRADTARVFAGLLAAICLKQHDPVAIYPFGADLAAVPAPTSDHRRLPGMLAALERLKPQGPTDICRVLERVSALPLRRGLMVLVSDFFDAQGIDAVISRLRLLRHRLLLAQVVRAVDADPPIQGEWTVVDCESGHGIDVTGSPRVRERYRAAYQAFQRKLRAFATARQAVHVLLDADQPVLAQLSGVFRNGTLLT